MEYVDNELELLTLVQECEDEYAFETLLRKFEKKMGNFINKIIITYNYKFEYDDLLQVARMALYEAFKTYNIEKNICKLNTYLYSCVKHKIYNYVRYENNSKRESYFNSVSFDSEHPCDVIAINEHIGIKFDETVSEYDFLINNCNKLNFIESLIFEMKLNNFLNKEIIDVLDINIKKYHNCVYSIRKKIKLGDN